MVAELHHNDRISNRGTPPTVAWSAGGQLAVTAQPNDIALWSTSTGAAPAWISDVSYGYFAISADTTRLLAGRTDESVRLIDLTTDKILHRTPPSAATGMRVDLDWAPGGELALVDGAIWRRDGRVVGALPIDGPWPNDAPVDHQWRGDTLFVAVRGVVRAIDARTTTQLWSHAPAHPPIDLHPAEPLLGCLTDDGEVALVDTGTHTIRSRFRGVRYKPGDDIRDESMAMRFSPDGRHLVVQRAFEPVGFCDVSSLVCRPLPIAAIQNAPPPRWRGDVVFIQASGVLAWSADPSKRWKAEAAANGFDFDVSPDGRHVAFGLGDEVRLVRLRDQRVTRLTALATDEAVEGDVEPITDVLLAP